MHPPCLCRAACGWGAGAREKAGGSGAGGGRAWLPPGAGGPATWLDGRSGGGGTGEGLCRAPRAVPPCSGVPVLGGTGEEQELPPGGVSWPELYPCSGEGTAARAVSPRLSHAQRLTPPPRPHGPYPPASGYFPARLLLSEFFFPFSVRRH